MINKHSKLVTTIMAEKKDFNRGNTNNKQSSTSSELTDILSLVSKVNFRAVKEYIGEDGSKIKRNDFVVIISTVLHATIKSESIGLTISNNRVYFYNGKYWEEVSTNELLSFLGEVAVKMGAPILMVMHYDFRNHLYKQFASISLVPSPVNINRVLLNLANGTLAIRNGIPVLQDFRKSDFMKYQLDTEYNPTATCPMFQNFLDEVLPDKNSQLVLAEFLGYLFIPNRSRFFKAEKVAVLYGSGANGKSVVFEVLNALLGKSNVTNYSLMALTDSKGYERAKIEGKLLNYGTELSAKADISIFKQLASGEPVEVRLPYGQPFLMTDYPKFIFNANVLPENTANSDAFFRRLIIIPFTVTTAPENQDKNLHSKIIATELSGVLNWVLAGLKRLLVQKGFTESPAIDDIIKKFRTDSDSVQLFIDDLKIVPSADKKMSLKNLYKSYREYCTSSGYRAINRSKFKKSMENKGFTTSRHGTGNVIYLKQIKPEK
jgi:putative DNA primase/helicase